MKMHGYNLGKFSAAFIAAFIGIGMVSVCPAQNVDSYYSQSAAANSAAQRHAPQARPGQAGPDRMAEAAWHGKPEGNAPQLSRSQLENIGRRIWQNEAGGSVQGLTSWNSGENFASLGIGHFIWYPAGQSGPFEESFPALLRYMRRSGVSLPGWLTNARGCPWPSRREFQRAQDSQKMRELRTLLSKTVALQTQFIVNRLHDAAPKMQQAAGRDGRKIAANIRLLGQTSAGNFAMIDYVNFKGEGLKASERYRGQGWGLLQVLQEMRTPASAQAAPAEFARAAKAVLTRRVQNSPPQRNERQWLRGWLNRVDSYAR